MKVHWTQNAIEQLIDIYEYIANDSAIYARRTIDCITKGQYKLLISQTPGELSPNITMTTSARLLQDHTV